MIYNNAVGVPNPDGWELTTDSSNVATWKTLTDEEITQIVSEKLETWNTKEAMIDFARAILKKARGK